MRRALFLILLIFIGCASSGPDIKRLSPSIASSKAPSECRVIGVIKDSPADKAGITVEDMVKSVNGQIPADAPALTDLVSAAPADSDFEVQKKDGASTHLKIHLNAGRPRLGLICDLAGWEKSGVTAAGNESVTVFDGPFALTASGIIDKGIAFLRVRIANNSDQPIDVKPELFSATDGAGRVLAVLSPKDVMCYLYGDKGAHLLALKKAHKETLDARESVPGAGANAEDHCEEGPRGKLTGSDPHFPEANAQYLATESLWPSTYQPETVADGLIYLKEPASLPVTLTGTLQGHTLIAKLGVPHASEKRMKHSELTHFFEAQKRGTALRLTLKNKKVFVGIFATYDSVDERAWFNTPSGGMLNSTSHSVEAIQYVEPLDQIPLKPSPGDLN